MVPKPKIDHCLRLTGIGSGLTSFIFASYSILYNLQSDMGKGFFSILIYLGLFSTVTSIMAYISETYRTTLFYMSLAFIASDFLIMIPILLFFHLL